MKYVRIALAAVAALALAAGPATAQSSPKVTGGGQIIADSSLSGPGDTIAFQAQETTQGRQTGPGVRGEVQYVPHLSGTGKWHGRVTCLDISGNVAVLGGPKTQGDQDPEFFEIYVEDNGPPGGDQGNDMIILHETDEAPDCDPDDFDPDDEMRLARGNVRVHSA